MKRPLNENCFCPFQGNLTRDLPPRQFLLKDVRNIHGPRNPVRTKIDLCPVAREVNTGFTQARFPNGPYVSWRVATATTHRRSCGCCSAKVILSNWYRPIKAVPVSHPERIITNATTVSHCDGEVVIHSSKFSRYGPIFRIIYFYIWAWNVEFKKRSQSCICALFLALGLEIKL